MRVRSGIGLRMQVYVVDISTTGRSRTSARFMTLADVGDELAFSQSQAYSLVRAGDLKGIQIGGRNQWRVERIMLKNYIQAQYRRAAEMREQLPAELPTEA